MTTGLSAQIENTKIAIIKVSGNCGMCKKTIEKAGSVTNFAEVVWDKNTKLATITYNEKKIVLSTILKKIAKAGYNNEMYKAKDKDYNKLPACCQYER
jgi:hypothetical protein